MAREPVVVPPAGKRPEGRRVDAVGASFAIHEWAGSGPARMHVHHADDEAWHVLEGALRFRFEDGEVIAEAGSTVFVPAGVAHTFEVATPDATRYLIVLTPRLAALIAELQSDRDPLRQHEIYRRHGSELLD